MLNSTRRIPIFILVTALAGCGNVDGSKRSGTLQVTASAEGLGANGYPFPPRAGQDLAFVDGWAVDFDRIIVVIDNIRLSEMPDRDPGDEGVTGPEVALTKGPFVVDLKGVGNAPDKGGAGQVAIRLPIEELTNRFDLEQRYAFSYDFVPANSDAVLVNMDADDPDLASMIERGERVLLVGRSQFNGQTCKSSLDSYDFAQLPKSVRFRFGLVDSVSYKNCQNPDNDGAALPGEESPRGIQMYPNRTTTAQITLHTDHLFWPSIGHENLPLFNHLAANAVEDNGGYLVRLEDLGDVPVPRITDPKGVALPWRSCVDPSLYAIPTQPPTMTLDLGSRNLSNLEEFIEFNARTMGHLNADGLCYVESAD